MKEKYWWIAELLAAAVTILLLIAWAAIYFLIKPLTGGS